MDVAAILTGAELETVIVAVVTLLAGLGGVVIAGWFGKRAERRQARRTAYRRLIGASEALGLRTLAFGARSTWRSIAGKSIWSSSSLLTALSMMVLFRRMRMEILREIFRLLPRPPELPNPIEASAVLDGQVELLLALEGVRLVGSQAAVAEAEKLFIATRGFIAYAQNKVWHTHRPSTPRAEEFVRLRQEMQDAHDSFVRAVRPEL
jgi:hypothetical protein